MALVRGVLLLVLSVIGGYLGYRTGTWYCLYQPVYQLIGQNFQLTLLSKIGFTVIGLLIAGIGYSKISAYISTLADNLRGMPANDKIALCIGALVGLLITFLLAPITVNQIEEPLLRTMIAVALAIVIVFLTTQGAMSMREELRKLLPPYGNPSAEEAASLKQAKILDTNVIIDGRIAEVCRTGFVEGTIYVPGFVLDELQLIADSSDALRRARGRRGLEILNSMQKEFQLVVRTFDHLLPPGHSHDPVDSRLVRLAKAVGGTLVTNDFNLNKVAELQGIRVLSVNELANSLKPVVLPGEELSVHVIKEGNQPQQGVAYLDDGTMVVVENARNSVGETVEVVVTSVLQTVNGKMIFANLKELAFQEEEAMDRNLRSYYRDRPRRSGPRH